LNVVLVGGHLEFGVEKGFVLGDDVFGPEEVTGSGQFTKL